MEQKEGASKKNPKIRRSKTSVRGQSRPVVKPTVWTFLTNHSHVLICLARDSDIVLKDVAKLVGVTERAVQRIVSELEEGGYIIREKDGRRNRYNLNLANSLRHPVESNCNLKSLVDLIK